MGEKHVCSVTVKAAESEIIRQKITNFFGDNFRAVKQNSSLLVVRQRFFKLINELHKFTSLQVDYSKVGERMENVIVGRIRQAQSAFKIFEEN